MTAGVLVTTLGKEEDNFHLALGVSATLGGNTAVNERADAYF